MCPQPFGSALRACEHITDMRHQTDAASAFGVLHQRPQETTTMQTTDEQLPGATLDTDLSSVEGHLFKPSGKWGYEVRLDYTGLDTTTHDQHALALQALAQATANATSRVILADLANYWTLVVTDGPAGYPIMVKGA
jgi:hypothetical protein